jgi:HEPN domain-containing protein
MKRSKEILWLATQWRKKAESDFRAAVRLLKARDRSLAGVICFLAQQCTEKYLKSRLVLDGIRFRKTHDITELNALLPVDDRPELADEEQDRLTVYAVVTRYPGDYVEIPFSRAEEAVEIARRVRRHFRRMLADGD